MKLTVITIEASPEDLRASRTVADALTDAFYRISDILGTPKQVYADEDKSEEDKDG